MAQESIADLETRLKSTINFFSRITGLKLTSYEFVMPPYDYLAQSLADTTLDFILGDEYSVHMRLSSDKSSVDEREFNCRVTYKVSRKDGELIGSRDYLILGQDKTKLRNEPEKMNRTRLVTMLSELHNIDVEDPEFMDYETFSVDELNSIEKGSYFKSIYLLLMCDLKERGAKLAPILSKNEKIREAMFAGKIEETDHLLKCELDGVELQYGSKALAHIVAESEKIMEFAYKRHRYHDHSVPLTEKFESIDIIVLPGDAQRKYNILVVEDFGPDENSPGSYKFLSRKTAAELVRIGKYAGSTVLSTFNISECMQVCGTGQVDVVVMDGGYFALSKVQEDLLKIGGEIIVKQGNEVTDVTGLTGADEKETWKQMIFEEVQRNGYTAPTIAIFPSNILEYNIGRYIDTVMLRQAHPLADVYERLSEDHEKWMELAGDVEIAALQSSKYSRTRNNDWPKLAGVIPIADQVTNFSIRLMKSREFESVLSYSEIAQELGKNLGLREFMDVLDSVITQQVPEFLDRVKPTEVMRGLLAVDASMKAYPQFLSEREVSELLCFEYSLRIKTASVVMADTGYFCKGDERHLHEFATLLSNAYLIARMIYSRKEHEDLVDEKIFKDPSNFAEDISTSQLIREYVLPAVFNTAKTREIRRFKRFEDPFTNFIIGYGRRLAKLSGDVNGFDQRFREEILPRFNR